MHDDDYEESDGGTGERAGTATSQLAVECRSCGIRPSIEHALVAIQASARQFRIGDRGIF